MFNLENKALAMMDEQDDAEKYLNFTGISHKKHALKPI
jgi:hypothetical protein